MQRETLTPRADWRAKCEAVGFRFHSQDGRYWDESACYRFSAEQIDELEAVTAELHWMCLAAVDALVKGGDFGRFALPPDYAQYVVNSWQQREPSLYGRFDFCYDGEHPPKLLEYNADTPTALIEAAVVQWHWLTEVHAEADQFNSIHEKLIARWQEIRGAAPVHPLVHFTCVRDSVEDLCNLEYLMDTALQAEIDARLVYIDDIGWDDRAQRFVDVDEAPIATLFKLYPWEWLAREAFGPNVLRVRLRAIEPAWKMLLSNKAILPLLWEMFPGHDNLLPAFFDDGRIDGPSVRKPLLAREGANIVIRTPAATVASEDLGYGAEGYVYQALAQLPDFGGGHAVIGSWVVGDRSAGVGIREDSGLITRNTSRFVPHYFE